MKGECAVCGEKLDPFLLAEDRPTHPSCSPFAISDEDPEAALIKKEMIEIIKWKDRTSARSTQVDLGPSELGSPCDLRLGYRMAGIAECNAGFDPWPAIVGTAIHSWLANAIDAWCDERAARGYGDGHGGREWLTEKLIQINDVVRSHPDLFNVARGVVIDHKSVSADVMKKVTAEGPPPGHVIQTQMYGYAYEQLGYKVNKVALAFYPRSGWLKNMHVWVGNYDRTVADRALNRPPAIASRLLELDVLEQPQRWEQVDRTPSKDCGWCPWYNRSLTVEQGASDRGCPGAT